MDTVAQKISDPLHKTALWHMHVDMGGKMVPFAGYDMPVQYADMGVLKEHLHTRTAAGLFDVSHMGQAVLTGADDPAIALEKIVPSDIRGLAPFKTRYTVLLNDKGGIVDDLMVTRWNDKTLYLVVNAACKEKDFALIQKTIVGAATLNILNDRALLALQGPKAENILAGLMPSVLNLKFMAALKTILNGHELYISRSGYTGEDGFEISLPNGYATAFAHELLKQADVKWIGLGARDSLRLEAGLCLYGHDLNDDTTPIEANLKWIIQKRRREEKKFTGADTILCQIAEGPSRLRVGILPEGRAPLREGVELFTDDQRIGIITSGGFGPSVNGPIAMGYVDKSHAATGTKLMALVRGQHMPCTVTPLPFIEHKYKKD